MELKRRFNFRKCFLILYAVAFFVYINLGFSAEATSGVVMSKIDIPSIGLSSDVMPLIVEHNKLPTPDRIVGSFSRHENKTLLIGHATTVFEDLKNIKLGDEILYGQTRFIVSEIRTLAKEDVDMNAVLSRTDDNTLILMTCAGYPYGNNDASHRLLVTAKEAAN